MDIKPEINDKLLKLEEKYFAMGQNMVSYLDGLLYSNYLTYWDYIHLDTLLSLQNTRTDFPDELIFITYHQHTELFFKLILSEIRQLADSELLAPDFFISRMQRMNRYVEVLVNSFEVMASGMDKGQFLKFRMSLLPASGFQSAQYRMIEICSTKFRNLIEPEQRHKMGSEATFEDMYDNVYWKKGATELSSGQPTLTLKQFELKYSQILINLAKEHEFKNLWMLHRKVEKSFGNNQMLDNELRGFDTLVNITWPLAHFRSAAKHLSSDQKVIEATGGTNWQKYLPPRFQKRMFFPELWSDEETLNWGKNG